MSRDRSSSRCSTSVASSPWLEAAREPPAGHRARRLLADGFALAPRVGLAGGVGSDGRRKLDARRAAASVGRRSSRRPCPDTESLNSRIPLPSERPISGSRFGAEDEQQHDQQDQELPDADSEGHGESVSGSAARRGSGSAVIGRERSTPTRRRRSEAVPLPSEDVRRARARARTTLPTRNRRTVRGTARDHEPARRAGGRHRDRQGCRPRGRLERRSTRSWGRTGRASRRSPTP